MINSKYFAKMLTNLFNLYGENYGVNFKIFADEGALKECEKHYGQFPTVFTSGLATISSTQLVPIKTIRLNTYVVEVELFVDTLKDGLNGDGESLYVKEVRKVLTELVDGVNGTTSAVKIDNVSYNQTMTVGYPTVGTKGEVGHLIDALPVYLTFNIVLFQDGINSNDSKLYVNGEEIPFTNLTLTRTKTAESNTFNGEYDTRTLMNSNSLSIDGVVPARMNNDFSKALIKDIVSGSNTALVVDLEIPVATHQEGTETVTDYESNIFIGTFGQGTASFDIATNVGLNFSIVKGVEETLDFEDWNEATDTEGRCFLDIPKALGGKFHCIFNNVAWFANPVTKTAGDDWRAFASANSPKSWKVYQYIIEETTTETDLTFTLNVIAGKTYRIDYGDGNVTGFKATVTEEWTVTKHYSDGAASHTYSVQEMVVDEIVTPYYQWNVYADKGDVVYLLFDDGVIERHVMVNSNYDVISKQFNSGESHTLKVFGAEYVGV